MTTKLAGKDTYFLPFNQGSNGAGSGKSNSIAWTAYRLTSLFNGNNKLIFSSVIVVTDRTVLDAQLQETIARFDHKLGAIETQVSKEISLSYFYDFVEDDKNYKNRIT